MSFNPSSFTKKLISLQHTQESIQTLSLWCVHHKNHHEEISKQWLRIFRTASSKLRLALFYLANDIVQTEKRKRLHIFNQSFLPAVKEALVVIRNDSANKPKVERVLKIWSERKIYAPEYLEQFASLLQGDEEKSPEEPQSMEPIEPEPEPIEDLPTRLDDKLKQEILESFRPENLISELERFQGVKDMIDRAMSLLPNVHWEVGRGLKNHLKDRSQGLQIIAEVDDAYKKVSEFVTDYELHLQQRSELIELLEHAQFFYNTQLSEASMVEKAYRTYGEHIGNVKEKLEFLKEKLPSSPPRDAPSPSPFEEPFSSLVGVAGTSGLNAQPAGFYTANSDNIINADRSTPTLDERQIPQMISGKRSPLSFLQEMMNTTSSTGNSDGSPAQIGSTVNETMQHSMTLPPPSFGSMPHPSGAQMLPPPLGFPPPNFMLPPPGMSAFQGAPPNYTTGPPPGSLASPVSAEAQPLLNTSAPPPSFAPHEQAAWQNGNGMVMDAATNVEQYDDSSLPGIPPDLPVDDCFNGVSSASPNQGQMNVAYYRQSGDAPPNAYSNADYTADLNSYNEGITKPEGFLPGFSQPSRGLPRFISFHGHGGPPRGGGGGGSFQGQTQNRGSFQELNRGFHRGGRGRGRRPWNGPGPRRGPRF